MTLSDGRVIQENVEVGKRQIATAPLGIPDTLGGNTPQAEKELVDSLIKEGELINSIPSSDTRYWEGKFIYPLKGEIIVTDPYGYSRQTVGTTLSHKGTDFRAATGTPVYAMNSGVVRYTGYLRNYGNTIVLDHGLGLQTIYMHLSSIGVVNGQSVEQGEYIGKSGDTGYVLGPHLHLSVKIDHVSIDPIKFMKLFGPGSLPK
jgi:murein DD-endopeptidase MepM/ murein hydrolase activator NlpD